MRDVSDMVAVGDLDSDAKGSGARKNSGKPQLDLIPVQYWICGFVQCFEEDELPAMCALRDFQQGDDKAIWRYLSTLSMDELLEAVAVFEFGAKKYKAWNWAKGMAWSVPTGCVLRHLMAIANGELVDEDSGKLHMGHVVCNLIMLDYYVTHYPQGDDRPPQ